jgi:hypothetical protein
MKPTLRMVQQLAFGKSNTLAIMAGHELEQVYRWLLQRHCRRAGRVAFITEYGTVSFISWRSIGQESMVDFTSRDVHCKHTAQFR